MLRHGSPRSRSRTALGRFVSDAQPKCLREEGHEWTLSEGPHERHTAWRRPGPCLPELPASRLWHRNGPKAWPLMPDGYIDAIPAPDTA